MNLNSKSKISGFVLAFLLVLGITSMAGATVQAQYPWGRDRQDRRDRDRDRDDRYRRDDRYGRSGGYNVYQIAQSRGYQDGLYTGSNDAQKRQSFNPERSHYYKDATEGYSSSYGNRNGYKQAYRDGFLRGYQDGYRRNGGGRGRGSGRLFPW